MEQFGNLKSAKEEASSHQAEAPAVAEAKDKIEQRKLSVNSEYATDSTREEDDEEHAQTNQRIKIRLLSESSPELASYSCPIPQSFSARMLARKTELMSSARLKGIFDPSAEELEAVLQSTTVREVVAVILFGPSAQSNKEDKSQDTAYWINFQNTALMDADVKISEWDNEIPQLFSSPQTSSSIAETCEAFLNSPTSSTRTTFFIHPVREKIPFCPKTCEVSTVDTVHWIANDEIVLERQLKISKVPMSDCFV